MNSGLFAFSIGVRALVLGGITFAVIELLATHRLYATAIVVTGIGLLVLADLARCISRGDRLLERFIDGLAAGDFERPPPGGFGAGFARLRSAIERAAIQLNRVRTTRQRQIDHLQTLIDNVSVALLVVQSDGALALANRAARKLATVPANRMDQINAIGPDAAVQLLDVVAGERRVVRLANGQRMLVSAAGFSADGATYRLFSLQNIESELDAAELKAWQELVRILAHEMMNSLTPIASLAESLRPLVEAPAAGEQRTEDLTAAIDTIARRSAGLMSFVERYRQMADLPPARLRPVLLASLVGRIEHLMAATLAENQIAYVSYMEPQDLVVSVDPDLLEQALINIFHNAVEAVAGIAGARIEVKGGVRGDDVAIEIADNGRGLDPAVRERIFVPFFTTKPGGSGIGLSLARQIMVAHHGRLEAAPDEPRGAVFTLILPAAGTTHLEEGD